MADRIECAAVIDVGGIWRAARETQPPCPRGIWRHFADEIGAIGGLQCCNCKKVVDR